MISIITDKYTLKQTDNIILIFPGQENKSDLRLSLSQQNIAGGMLKGFIKDSSKNPIKGALIKIMTQDYDPVMHTISDDNGQYTLNTIPVGKTFKVYAIAEGKLLKEGSLINLINYQKISMDFILEDDPSSNLGIIAGDIIDLNSNLPIKEAVAELYLKKNDTENLLATTKSNEYGQFTFRNVALGDYNIILSSPAYTTHSSLVSIINKGQIVPLKVSLIQNKNNSDGTVSGVINDETGNPIENADVLLYRVEDNDNLTPIKFTKTNSNGVYLFQNIVQAKYKIKANEDSKVTLVSPNSPNYYGFIIGTSTTLTSKVISVGDEANLFNGTLYVFNNTFVSEIGGDLDGYMTINLAAEISGYYDITIKYLSGNFDTTIILQEDPDDNGPQSTLNFSKTSSWNLKDAKSLVIRVPLNAGVNKFKLFNSLGNHSPWIGNFTLSYVEQSYSADMIDGIVDKGAIYLAPFVTFLGGPTNGEVNITVDVYFTKNYKLLIQYLAGDENRPLKIDVDGVNIANLMLSKTNDWSLLSAKTYELPISLEEGERRFKFYNDTGAYAVNVGDLIFDEYIINKLFLPEDVVLLDGAEIKTDISGASYIDNITLGKGEIKINVDVFETQLYDFVISYSCSEDTICNIKVNDTLLENQDFIFPATGISTKAFRAKLFLEEGTNIITIFNQ